MVGENQAADVWDCLSQAFSTPVNGQTGNRTLPLSLSRGIASAIQRGFCHRLLVTGGDITGDSGDVQAARLLTLWTLRGPDHLHSAPRPDPPAFKFWEQPSLTAPGLPRAKIFKKCFPRMFRRNAVTLMNRLMVRSLVLVFAVIGRYLGATWFFFSVHP